MEERTTRVDAKRFACRIAAILAYSTLSLLLLGGCTLEPEENGRRALPKSLRDVPADKLAYRFTPDVEPLPEFEVTNADEKHAAVQADFVTRRAEEALLRTVVSPDGQRVLAVYATHETPEGAFRIDLYSSDGSFLRNILPLDLVGAFPQSVAWSPDGQAIAFIGKRHPTSQTTETPQPPPLASPSPPEPSASVAPLIPSVPTFSTEQIYVCDRDGFALRPLTARDGLIYFHLAWALDGHAIAALACKEFEFDARMAEGRPTAGRPRLITLDGQERLLDDRPTDVLPVWSPDSSKVAAAFDTEVMIYDAASPNPTQASIPLHDPLLEASARYDAERLQASQNEQASPQLSPSNGTQASKPNAAPARTSPSPEPSSAETPLSFNPIIRLEWPQPDKIYLQTGFVRIYANETVTSYLRWHLLEIHSQIMILK